MEKPSETICHVVIMVISLSMCDASDDTYEADRALPWDVRFPMAVSNAFLKVEGLQSCSS